MKTDIEIAQEAKMKPITQIAAQLGLEDESVIPYGRYKAKIDHRLIHNAKKQGKLILVTAISPTPAGEGKTTTSVGLADAMNALGTHPWQVSFSYGRALQAPVLAAWKGLEANAAAAQKALQKRCRLNGLARDGAYARAMENEA